MKEFPHKSCPLCNVEWDKHSWQYDNNICSVHYAKYYGGQEDIHICRKDFADSLIMWFDDGKCVVLAGRSGAWEFRNFVMRGIWLPFDIDEKMLGIVLGIYAAKKGNIASYEDMEKLLVLV